MIICLGTTPAVQRVMSFKHLVVGAVNRAVDVAEEIAGKSVNVAKVLHALGCDVLATGFVGGDRGQAVLDQLGKLGVRADFVRTSARTRMCVTLIDQQSLVHTELVEESRAVEPQAWPALRAKLAELLPHASMLTLSGTLVPGAPIDFYGECVQLASNRGLPTIVDAVGEVLQRSLPHRPALVKPNRLELAATVGMPVDCERAIISAMRRLIELGAQRVLVTMGPEGAIAADGPRAWRIRIPRIAAVNSIGSGDAVTAGLAAALTRGQDFPAACRLGAACGTANALTLLAGDVRMEDVRRIEPQVVVEEV